MAVHINKNKIKRGERRKQKGKGRTLSKAYFTYCKHTSIRFFYTILSLKTSLYGIKEREKERERERVGFYPTVRLTFFVLFLFFCLCFI